MPSTEPSVDSAPGDLTPRIFPATSEVIAAAAGVILQGGVVAYPTETLYGLAVDALELPALELLLHVKERTSEQTISVLVADLQMLRRLVEDIPPLAQKLMTKYWPGPLTLILPARPGLPSSLVSARGGIGVRISSDAIAAELVRSVGRPITATSANRSHKPPATSAVEACIPGVSMILDGGGRTAVPSTVVELLDKPVVLRRGSLALEEL